MPGDDASLHLARPFVDARGSHLTIEVFERMTVLERTRAKDLHSSVDDLLSTLGRVQFRHR